MEENQEVKKIFCTTCGAEREEHHKFCAICGQKLVTDKTETAKKEQRGFKFWALFALLLLLALYLVSLFRPESQTTTTEQLKALKEGRTTEAYFAFTSKEYQQKTPLIEFRKFLENNPELVNYKTINTLKEALADPLGTWDGTLVLNDGSIAKVHYEFIKEDNKWKVLKIGVERAHTPLSTQGGAEAKTRIGSFLESLKKQDLAEAYYKHTTKGFQEEMSLSAFEEFLHIFPLFEQQTGFEIKEVSIDKDRIVILASLKKEEENYTVKFTLDLVAGEWKIGNIDVIEKKSSLAFLDPKTILEMEFKALRNHELAKAYYELGSKEFQSTTPYKDFVRFVKATPTLYDNKKAHLSNPIIEGELATVQAELTSIFGEKSQFQIELIYEKDSWKLFHMAKEE